MRLAGSPGAGRHPALLDLQPLLSDRLLHLVPLQARWWCTQLWGDLQAVLLGYEAKQGLYSCLQSLHTSCF